MVNDTPGASRTDKFIITRGSNSKLTVRRPVDACATISDRAEFVDLC